MADTAIAGEDTEEIALEVKLSYMGERYRLIGCTPDRGLLYSLLELLAVSSDSTSTCQQIRNPNSHRTYTDCPRSLKGDGQGLMPSLRGVTFAKAIGHIPRELVRNESAARHTQT